MTVADVVRLANENPGAASAIGSAVGGAVAGTVTGLTVAWKAMRKSWRREAYGVARAVIRQHEHTCAGNRAAVAALSQEG